MKLRTQLALWFLLLTAVPITGLALYSYHSSSEAVRTALEEEAAELAAEMDEKLVTARRYVTATMENARPIELEELGGDEEATARQITLALADSIGSAAPLVRDFRFTPFDEFDATSGKVVPESGDVVIVDGTERSEYTFSTVEPVTAPTAPEAPAAPQVPRIVINREAILERAREEAPAGGEQIAASSVGAALEVLEAIPLETILAESLSAVEAGLREAEAGLEAEAAGRAEAREKVLRERRESFARTREEMRRLAEEQSERNELRREEILREGAIPVVREGNVVGSVAADVDEERILREIFLGSSMGEDEIPFALDGSGKLYTRSKDEEALLEALDIPDVAPAAEGGRSVEGDWVVATTSDEETGTVVGVARPATEALSEVRSAAATSFVLGMGLVGLCLIGIFPLANHMTRDIGAVAAGAERISKGDLDSRVEVDSRNEVGRLAHVFNTMAGDLKRNQARLVEEETARREQEIRQRLLEEEYDRTAGELEEARQFQLSMLPSKLPDVPGLEIAVEMITAAEVGGDYYDFSRDHDGLTIAIGDGTGHGAKAGTMVAVIKSLFTAFHSTDLCGFLRDASKTIRSMQLGRMSMALTLMRIEGSGLRYAAAGMPPLILVRADGSIEELSMAGAPLGTIEYPYEDASVELGSGDTIVAMSDGLPELIDASGEPFGYERVRDTLRDAAGQEPATLIASLQSAARVWRGDHPQADDMTLLAVRIG